MGLFCFVLFFWQRGSYEWLLFVWCDMFEVNSVSDERNVRGNGFLYSH